MMKILCLILIAISPHFCFAEENCVEKNKSKILSVIDDAIKYSLANKNDDLTHSILPEAAGFQACLGQFKSALKTAKMIERPDIRNSTLAAIALSYAQKKKFDPAFKVIQQTPYKNRLLKEISLIQVKQNDIEGANKTIALIMGNQFKGLALLDLAIQYSQTGNRTLANKTIGEALELLHLSLDDESVLSKTATAYAYAGNVKESRKWVKLLSQKIKNKENVSFYLRNISIGFTSSGLFDNAKEIAERISDRYYREEAFLKIGTQGISHGKTDEIMAMVLSPIAKDSLWREEILLALVDSYIEQKRLRDATKLIPSIDLTGFRIRALIQIYSEQKKLNDEKSAMESLNKIKNLLEVIERKSLKAKLFAELASSQAVVGNMDEARDNLRKAVENAKNIDYSKKLVPGLGQPIEVLVKVQLQMGDKTGAQNTLKFTLEKLNDIYQKKTIYPNVVINSKNKIAVYFLLSGDEKTPLKIALDAKNQMEQNAIFTEIASAKARQVDLDSALKWCSENVPKRLKSLALMAIVQSVIESNQCSCNDPFANYLEDRYRVY